MKIPIFRKDQWIEYSPPREVPAGWLNRHTLQAASLYATAIAKGYSSQESISLAEMYIFKQIFPGILYDSKFESKLVTLVNHEEIASDPTKSEKREMCEEKTQQA